MGTICSCVPRLGRASSTPPVSDTAQRKSGLMALLSRRAPGFVHPPELPPLHDICSRPLSGRCHSTLSSAGLCLSSGKALLAASSARAGHSCPPEGWDTTCTAVPGTCLSTCEELHRQRGTTAYPTTSCPNPVHTSLASPTDVWSSVYFEKKILITETPKT